MARQYMRVVVVAVAAAGAVVVAGGGTTAQDKMLTIREIMKAGHGGAEPLLGQVTSAAKGGKWDAAVAAAKSLDSNAALMEKATPKRDEGKTWEKLSGRYHENTSALLAAAEKKDAAGVKEAAGAIGSSCKECHTNHKAGKGK